MARIRYEYKKREFALAMAAIEDPVAAAGSGAILDAADIAKKEGRADIAAAGFSKRWQNTLRSEVYPKLPRVSMNAAAMIWHAIPYAGIFEDGGTIAGKPKLWLPLRSTPPRIGNKKMTPALYQRQIGPLFSINRPGRAPLLAAKIASNRRGQTDTSKVTLSALRRGGGGAPSRLVPLFVGIDRVTMPDKFSIRQIVQAAADKLPGLYLKNLKVD